MESYSSNPPNLPIMSLVVFFLAATAAAAEERLQIDEEASREERTSCFV